MARSGEGESAELQEIAAVLRTYLRSRSRGLVADHEDLIQQTLIDLFRLRNERAADAPALPEPRVLALAILRRRIADRYRELTRRIIAEHSLGELESETAGQDLTLQFWYASLLRRVLRHIAGLSVRDQQLLLDDRPFSTATARTTAERRQLSRLRSRLRRELGTSLELDADDEKTGE